MPRSLGDIFNIIVTPNFLSIAGRRNITNISQRYDSFESSTCRIKDILCVTKICYMGCIFVGIQKKFIALALNGITTLEKIRDRTFQIPTN